MRISSRSRRAAWSAWRESEATIPYSCVWESESCKLRTLWRGLWCRLSLLSFYCCSAGWPLVVCCNECLFRNDYDLPLTPFYPLFLLKEFWCREAAAPLWSPFLWVRVSGNVSLPSLARMSQRLGVHHKETVFNVGLAAV